MTLLSSSTGQPSLRASGLSYALGKVRRRVQVLRSLSLEVHPGEKVAIIGPSGCGKSTLLSILGLLERPDAGEVWVNGVSMAKASEQQRARMRSDALGFVFQFHFLLESFTLLENLLLAMRRFRGVSTAAVNERACALLSEVGLGDKIHRRPHELSGGEQQRAAVARALAHDPQILLADEPTGNLDTASADRVFSLIAYLAEKKGQGVVLVTHNLSIAQRCDRVLSMQEGILVPHSFVRPKKRAAVIDFPEPILV